MSPETTRRSFLQTVVIGTGALRVWDQSLGQQNRRKPDRLSGLDDYVEQAMSKWDVPGLAIAIVQDGKLIHARGYGVRSTGTNSKVNAETVFGIASCTKAFTASAIGKLVDDAKVRWDDPIARHLSAFQLFDPELTAKVTIRQALSHRTGLPTANMLWRSGAFNSAEILSRLRWLKPVAAPGERFLYNNNMYLVLGRLVEQDSGRKWTEFLRKELLEPLGMKSTVGESSGIRGLENVAAPHASANGKLQRLPPYYPDVIAPAGAIHSSVLDMAQWLKMHLSGGMCDGVQVLSSARIEEMHAAPRRSEDKAVAEPNVPRAPISNYGLGWFFNEHGGRQVIEHSGVQTGFVSWVAMMPEERLGLVVLANHHQTGLNSALRSWIFDACLGLPIRDWSEQVRSDYSNGYQRLLREAKAQFESKRPAPTQPPQPLSSYAGTYESKLYGLVRITVKNDRLRLQFGSRFEGELEHWQDDAFRVTFPNPRLDDWLVTFAVKAGTVSGMQIKESPWAPAWYDDADDLGEFRRE